MFVFRKLRLHNYSIFLASLTRKEKWFITIECEQNTFKPQRFVLLFSFTRRVIPHIKRDTWLLPHTFQDQRRHSFCFSILWRKEKCTFSFTSNGHNIIHLFNTVLDARNTIVNGRDKGPILVEPYILLETGNKQAHAYIARQGWKYNKELQSKLQEEWGGRQPAVVDIMAGKSPLIKSASCRGLSTNKWACGCGGSNEGLAIASGCYIS